MALVGTGLVLTHREDGNSKWKQIGIPILREIAVSCALMRAGEYVHAVMMIARPAAMRIGEWNHAANR